MTRTSIAITADTHCDDSSRMEEHDRVMEFIAWDAKGRGAQALLHAGDVYERTSTSRERASVIRWVSLWRSLLPTVIVSGNHDDVRDIEALEALHGTLPFRAFTRPGRIHLEGICDVHAMPWPNKAYLLAGAEGLSRAEADAQAVLALKAILRDSADNWLGDVPRIFLGHVMARGSQVSVSQPPLVGCDFELGLDDLALAQADFYALGHIHMPQDWVVENNQQHGLTEPPVAYPGSPMRKNFGELEEKSYLLVTFEGRRCVSMERIPTPCAPMLHLTGTYDPLGALVLDEHIPIPQGAEVRLRYACKVEDRERARACAEELSRALQGDGARSVKLEDVVQVEQRARAPEVAAALTHKDRLLAYWKSKGELPERSAHLLAKLETLDAP